MNEVDESEEISEETVNDYVKKFTKSSFEEKLTDILPLIHRANTIESKKQKVNQVDRVKNILQAYNEDGSVVNNITFNPSTLDMNNIKKTELDENSDTPSLSQTFADLANRIQVESCDDNRRHDRSNDRAAELSIFLRNIAEQVKTAPQTIERDALELGARLVKMSNSDIANNVVETTIEDKMDDMLSEAFKSFNNFD